MVVKQKDWVYLYRKWFSNIPKNKQSIKILFNAKIPNIVWDVAHFLPEIYLSIHLSWAGEFAVLITKQYVMTNNSSKFISSMK